MVRSTCSWSSLVCLLVAVFREFAEGDQKRNYIFPKIWLEENYNKHELPPTTNNDPVVVNVSIYLSSIIKIDDPTQVKIKLLRVTECFSLSSFITIQRFLYFSPLASKHQSDQHGTTTESTLRNPLTHHALRMPNFVTC